MFSIIALWHSLSFLANFSEGKLWWNVPVCFHRNRKKTLLFINAGLFKWSRGSAVFTGPLLKCSTIFLSEMRLQPGSSSGRQHRKAVPSHIVTARPSYFRLKHLVPQYLECPIYFWNSRLFKADTLTFKLPISRGDTATAVKEVAFATLPHTQCVKFVLMFYPRTKASEGF